MPGVWAGVCLVTAIADSIQCARGALGADDHGGTGLLHRACLAVCVDALEPTGISGALFFLRCEPRGWSALCASSFFFFVGFYACVDSCGGKRVCDGFVVVAQLWARAVWELSWCLYVGAACVLCEWSLGVLFLFCVFL